MPVTASSRVANLKRSLDVYFHAQLGGSYPIDWTDGRFNDAGEKEWLQPGFVGPIRPPAQFYRQVSATERGELWLVLYNVHIFIRPALQTVQHRLLQIRDEVLSRFTEFTKIDVLDYEGAQASLGKLPVHGISLDREITDPALSGEMRQWTVAPELRWVGTWQP